MDIQVLGLPVLNKTDAESSLLPPTSNGSTYSVPLLVVQFPMPLAAGSNVTKVFSFATISASTRNH